MWDGRCPKRCDGFYFDEPSKFFIQIIDKIIIKCFRCCQSIKYSNFKKHVEKECDKILTKCDNDKCKVEIEKGLHAQHMKTCIYGRRTCEECGTMVTRKDLKNRIEYLQQSNNEKNESLIKYRMEAKENEKQIENLKKENDYLNEQLKVLKEIYIPVSEKK